MIGNPDDERLVELADDDDLVVLPDQTRDESELGWGGYPSYDDDDARLLEERPPHW
ncbi:hypothetical protein NE235_05885 [Actinoallomurus spadix]|uniref:Uncharacterized protein n=1 Tax=Actinoallomurus spadix TaxID=79912 RepID=A0ABN0W499_9ACTN|nr:hypothetical protein [Actinoallomurus spadix]MCO5985634.1 hypothetical protein [Actinoallomurus spadix]